MKPLIITVVASTILWLPLTKPTHKVVLDETTTAHIAASSSSRATLASVVSSSKTDPVATIKKPASVPASSGPASTAAVQAAPAPTTPAPAPVTYASGCSIYQSTFDQYDWDVEVAMAICQAESSGNPYAVSDTNDYGLMQLHDEEIFNPYDNIAAAYQKYLEQGWEAWTSYNTGVYLEYL